MKRTVMITGGGRGIGFGIAKKFAENGYNLALMSRSPRSFYDNNLKELEDLGCSYIYISGSVAEADDRERFLNETIKTFGTVEVLVNAAGVAPKVRKDILEMTEESFDYVVKTNLRGPVFMTQLVANQMITQPYIGEKRATIINIGSASTTVSSTNRGEYCISKAGVAMMTTLYADRLASEGILVHEVRPGVIDTDMTRVVHEKYTKMIENGEFPIARWGTAEDVARIVFILCSDECLYTTGNYIDVDGGFHIRRM